MVKIDRKFFLNQIRKAFKACHIVGLIGPRQSGKTTLAKNIQKESPEVHYFDLSNPKSIEKLSNLDAMSKLKGLVIIDEIQLNPDIFSYLKFLHNANLGQKFLILGSATRDIIKQATANLSGRVAFIEITPFSLNEVDDIEMLWAKGGFPNSYLVDWEESKDWRRNYMLTYIEQDIADFGFQYDVEDLRKLATLLAHYHGQKINYGSIASAISVKQEIVKRYISYLKASFILRVLNPWHDNLKKQQTKNPKIYYRDSGLFHHLLNIQTYSDIFSNSKAGASFEGFAIEEIIRVHNAKPESCYFFSIDQEMELDLLILDDGVKRGFEIKKSDVPKLTSSMKAVMKRLELDFLTVIYPEGSGYMLDTNIRVVSLSEYIKQYSRGV